MIHDEVGLCKYENK